MPTATHTAPRPDVNEMVVIHRVFRREFAALPPPVRRTPAGDIARARAAARTRPLSPAQQDRLADLFKAIALGLRDEKGGSTAPTDNEGIAAP